jgi:hypothetical protein
MGPSDPDNQRPDKWSSIILQQSPILSRSTLSRVPQTQESAQIRKYDTEDVFELHHFDGQKSTLDDLV